MVRILTVLFISSVFLFGICNGDSKEHKLENDIKKAEEKLSTLTVVNSAISVEITTLDKIYTSKIKTSHDLKNKKNEQIKKQLKEREDLQRQMVESHLEEDEIRKVRINIEQLKLDIKVTEENIKILEERRKNNISTSCWKLEGMAKNHKTLLRVSVLAFGRTDKSIILKNKLRQVLKELDQARKKKSDLYMQWLRANHKLHVLDSENVDEAIKKLRDDIKKGQAIIDKSKKALEEQKKKVAELKKSCEAKKNELDKWKKEAKKVVDKFNIYALDVECYKKLHNDMVTLVTSKP